MTFFVFNPEVESERETAKQVIKLYEQNEKENPEQKKLLDEQEKKYYCNNPECKKEIEKAVVGFCLNNKDRFGGKVYCRECQEGY